MEAIISPPSWSVRAVRWSVALHAAALLVQIVAMLLFMSGTPEGFLVHLNNARIVLALALVQLLTILACRPARANKPFIGMAATVVIAEALAMYFGHHRLLFAHLTLALIVWGFSLTLLIRTVTAPPWAKK